MEQIHEFRFLRRTAQGGWEGLDSRKCTQVEALNEWMRRCLAGRAEGVTWMVTRDGWAEVVAKARPIENSEAVAQSPAHARVARVFVGRRWLLTMEMADGARKRSAWLDDKFFNGCGEGRDAVQSGKALSFSFVEADAFVEVDT